MTAKHTPGPWLLEVSPHPNRKRPYLVICGDTSYEGEPDPESWESLGEVYGPSADGDEHVAIANARLIAAAPDMLAALKSAQESIATFIGVHKYPINSGAGDILNEVSAAIAKAEGRS